MELSSALLIRKNVHQKDRFFHASQIISPHMQPRNRATEKELITWAASRYR